jgi:predicted amidohydrolase
VKKVNKKIRIATCQYAVSADVGKNFTTVKKQIRYAKSHKADIVHFSESSLSGYAGIDFKSFEKYDERVLSSVLEDVIALAAEYKIWLIIGSHHYNKGCKKPTNCLYLINDKGQLVNRYDKRLLYSSEFDYYEAGDRQVIFKINGISCGLLICHEWRYPEVYRNYKHSGVELVFHSWYDGYLSTDQYEKEGRELGQLITGTVKGNAANNYLWISASNTSGKESSFAAFVAQPDGRILRKLQRNRAGVLISEIDINKKFADPSGHLRNNVSSI